MRCAIREDVAQRAYAKLMAAASKLTSARATSRRFCPANTGEIRAEPSSDSFVAIDQVEVSMMSPVDGVAGTATLTERDDASLSPSTLSLAWTMTAF